MQPVSSRSGATMCTGKPAAGAGKRTEAWTAKNRRAQKKFREKAKVNKNNMQQQLADMTAQLNALEMEHNKLTGKNSVLEMVLSSRQAQLQILHEQQKAPQQQSKNMQQQQSQQNALLQQQQPDKTADLAITATPTTQTQGQDVNAVYAEIVDNLRGVVQRLDKDGQSAALDAELKDQGQAAGMFILCTVLSNSENLRKLYMVNIDPEDWDTSDLVYRSPEHWQAVTDSLKLTSEQKADMVKLRAVCLAKQAENQAQWHHLCDAIAQATVGNPAERARPDMALDSQRLVALRSNLRRGQAIWLELYQQIFGKVWTPMQYARAVVKSGPHHVDALAIASCVAQASGADL